MKKNQKQIAEERKKVYQKILDFVEKNFLVPTLDEIGAELGLAKSVVRLRLKELEASGELVLAPGRARGIMIQYDAFKGSRKSVNSTRSTTSRSNVQSIGVAQIDKRKKEQSTQGQMPEDLNAFLEQH